MNSSLSDGQFNPANRNLFLPVEHCQIKPMNSGRSAHAGGAPCSIDQMMRMAKTAADFARIQKMAERFKGRPKILNLKEDFQQLVDAAAEGGIDYLV